MLPQKRIIKISKLLFKKKALIFRRLFKKIYTKPYKTVRIETSKYNVSWKFRTVIKDNI